MSLIERYLEAMEDQGVVRNESKFLQKNPYILELPLNESVQNDTQTDLQFFGELRRIIRVAILNDLRI